MQGDVTLHVLITMKNTRLIGLLACATLSGCSSPGAEKAQATHVDRELILPKAAERYEKREREVFFLPVPIESPMPIYPVALAINDHNDAVVCVEITISAIGAVSKVEPIALDTSCVSDKELIGRTLLALTSDAVLRWTYFSAGICAYQTSEAECSASGAVIDPVAVKLSYKFIFRKGGVAFEQARERAL